MAPYELAGGLLMGSALTAKVSWRWCFYINLPIRGLSMFVITVLSKATTRRVSCYAPDGPNHPTIRSTWYGMGSASVDQCTILKVTNSQLDHIYSRHRLSVSSAPMGGSLHPWNSALIITLLCLFDFLIVVFIAVQMRTQDTGTVPVRILKDRVIMAAAWCSLCFGASFFILVQYGSKGVSAVKSGIHTLPMAVSLALGSMIAGGVVKVVRYSSTPFIILSSILVAVDDIRSRSGFRTAQPIIAAQAVLSPEDLPRLRSSSSCRRSVARRSQQNVFTNKLVSGLNNIPDINPAIIADVDHAIIAGIDLAIVLSYVERPCNGRTQNG
ncbi:hypothetical protein DFH07DRAFT_941856 [Mycena maculata]|uniref:Uncharacterized protein n=1 Tax=Mycena maculata TaxID=230809 RepID=A0AAD7N9J8_9AGAR|nr:hypothetical protein DFH07DRAFT_941856 [Mycena maculata]